MPDAMGISSRETILPVVPMFHANAWGLAQAAPMIGAKLVMPGGKMDGASIYELLDTEKVTFTAAVPTVWLMLLQHLEETGKKLPHLKKVVIGGSACPRAMTEKFQENYDVEVIHAWGMTEMSPLGTLGTMKPEYADLEGDERLDIKEKQGHAPFGVEMKVTDDDDRELPWNGKTFGRLKVRGPAVARAYYGGAGADQFDEDGWFDTGDVAHIDPQRLHADHRPRQGRDQVRRRMDIVDRSRKPRGRPSRCRRGGGDRRAAPAVGRAAAADRRAQARPRGVARTTCSAS